MSNRAKPAEIRHLEGNPGQRKIPTPPRAPAVLSPAAPRWLPKEAIAEWKRLAPILVGMGVLTTADLSALTAYCATYARWREARTAVGALKVTKAKSGYQMVNPLIAQERGYLKEMRQFLVEFGLTPSSRMRIGVKEPDKGKGLDELLAGPRLVKKQRGGTNQCLVS